ncbi:MAG: PIN domain-containing protein [Polaromonas sp.]|uniref:PIN domain-containing protein n=1 Tax=Polaromonas sp. TaxID=1869339 RepID=UPI0017B04419|nr:PIN domain-containing protein [Polaromonas sp.]MBA3594127.1 PIN domain-containing protein [Polaromonas sp.]
MRVALDSNILVYAEGLGDETRCTAALQLIEQLPMASVVLPAQALGELTRVLTGKARRPLSSVRETVLGWADSFEVADSNWSAFQAALDLVVDHQLPMWDALILAVAAESHCRLLLSEDFQNGFTWRGVTVVDPFAAQRSPLLSGLLTH